MPGVEGAALEARRTRSSSLKLAGLMVAFLAFAVAVLLNDDVLAGDSARSIDHRPTQYTAAAAPGPGCTCSTRTAPTPRRC
jgi:hypothetical protein